MALDTLPHDRTADTRPCSPPPLRVAFVHPDLGIGGAERLVVDAAVALHARGHAVTLAATHWDASRSFDEVCSGAAGGVRVLPVRWVRVVRRVIPGQAAQAAVLCGLVALLLVPPDTEAVVVDLVAWPVVVLRWRRWWHTLWRRCLHWNTRRTGEDRFLRRILFYCHFPDALLAPGAQWQGVDTGVAGVHRPEHRLKRWLRRAYRRVVDAVERWSVSLADVLIVNSEFTAAVVQEVFASACRKRPPQVVYPPIEVRAENGMLDGAEEDAQAADERVLAALDLAPGEAFVLSINRYERKKRVELALQAWHLLQTDEVPEATSARLVIAGGYDSRLPENVQYFGYLATLRAELGIRERVILARNVSDVQRAALLRRCQLVLYTPSYEHFGIVPLEAMRAGKAVVACDSGGPRESIVDGATGVLCPEPVTPRRFADAISSLLRDTPRRARMGAQGARRVRQHFSRERFGQRLEALVQT
ncbi:hypothetical protein CDCA_CDCA01G0400 [Cyanidium caldarium]|uniref:Alpha-1,3/1,6-mannosyltransferase ALG2 n=1 Tax=Cyanidium caldarium TaxID=2771 RepID=A0AAV9IQM0_CYACA|nr:hypothetical protein CDCA_CDCA01G0400 [Cyanidium caldarium]